MSFFTHEMMLVFPIKNIEIRMEAISAAFLLTSKSPMFNILPCSLAIIKCQMTNDYWSFRQQELWAKMATYR